MSLLQGEDGDWRWAVRPDLGAAITRLEWRGRPILRPAPEGVDQVLETGCFPLVAYANRVGHGRFAFAGETVRLPVLPAFSPHALHGDGWQARWERVESPEVKPGAVVELVYRHEVGGGEAAWPWAYEARQALAFEGDAAVLTVSIENLSDRPMPWGLGLHPYFPAEPETQLAFAAEGVWETGRDQLPIRLSRPDAVFDWSAGPRVAEAPFVDHCYSGCGVARLIQADHEVVIRASDNAPWAQVYAPGRSGSGRDFVCFEPVTHRPDAFNAPQGEGTGAVPMGPGEVRSMTMTLTVGAR